MEIDEKLSRFRQESSQLKKTDAATLNKSSISTFFSNIFTQVDKKPSNLNNHKTEKKVKHEVRPNEAHLKQRLVRPLENNMTKCKNDTAENEDDLTNQAEIEENFKTRITRIGLKVLLWLILFAIFVRIEFGVVYVVVSSLVLIYLNTNKRKRQGVSAYSVFNPNVERLPGQLTAEQLEQSLIRGF
jgi:hypothetical protein